MSKFNIQPRNCYICGEKVVVEPDEIWFKIKCTNCPLDFGRYWFTNKFSLVRCWNNWTSKEDAKQ